MARAAATLLLVALVGSSTARAEPPAAARAEAAEWAVAAGPGASGGSVVDLRVEARAGYHVNLEYPMAFVPSPDSTARFPSARMALRPTRTAPCAGGGKDVCSATLELPYAPPETGEVRVAGTLAFSVCTAEKCLIQKVPLSLAVATAARSG